MLHPQQDALVTTTTGVNYHLLQEGLTAQASALENGESATSPMTAQTAHPCLDDFLLRSYDDGTQPRGVCIADWPKYSPVSADQPGHPDQGFLHYRLAIALPYLCCRPTVVQKTEDAGVDDQAWSMDAFPCASANILSNQLGT